MYNLTLLEHNVYYANGILVQNCADAWVLMCDVARLKHHLTAIEKPPPRPVEKNATNSGIFASFFDLASMQQKKKGHNIATPVLQEAAVASGGGWGE